jgi:hypothetical protein
MAVSSQTGIEESTLVSQAREGDKAAFSELVRARMPKTCFRKLS